MVTSVVAVDVVSPPPLGSAVSVKVTLAFLTRLFWASRTTTEMVELLLVWDGTPVVTWTVLGTACTAMLLAVVATNTTSSVADGVLFGPDAVIVAGPAKGDEMDTLALPAPSVVAGLPARLPRLVEKETVWPTTGAPEAVQWTTTGVAVFRGMSTDGAGVVNAKPAPLTVRDCVLLAPAAVAVIVSLPPTLAVTTAITWPAELVVPEAGEIEFPVA